MTNQVVNTERILEVAQTLTTTDANIQTYFEVVEKKSNAVAISWNSAASAQAETLLLQMKQSNQARATVLQNYINFLSQTVSPNYVSTEDANTTLADQFL